MTTDHRQVDDGYDVVIVGGGIAGATVAKIVADSGAKRILMLEAGRATGMSSDKYNSHVEAMQASIVGSTPNSPYPNNPNAPQADVLDIKQLMTQPTAHHSSSTTTDTRGYLVQTGPLPFASDYTRALGGTTLHWLGTSLRMLPNDFKLKSLYGHGLDWPFGYEDLRDYYERAERDIIGVAGDVNDQFYPGVTTEELFGDFQYPMYKIPPSYSDQVLADGLDGKTITVQGHAHEVRMSNTPVGRNSTPRGDYEPVGAVGNPQQGQRCEGNTNCIPICPVQAKYNALKTLYELMIRHPANQELGPKHSAVRIVTQAVATKVELDEHGRVSGIVYQPYDDEDIVPTTLPRVARGKIYVLAAHAMANATLLLASGAANSSGMVGRNLMDHPLILTWALSKQKLWGFRGPLSTSGLEMFRDGEFRSRHCAFRIEVGNEGWNFSANAPTSTLMTMVGQGKLFGRPLRRKLGEVLPRQFRLALEMEQIPETSNYVTIDPAYRDQLGNFRPVIRYDIPEYLRAGMAAAKEASDKMFALLDIPPLGPDDRAEDFPYPRDYTTYSPADPGYLTYKDKGYTYYGAGHIAGTHLMGSSPSTSVVDDHQRSWDHDNLYLVGCGNMPTVGTSNPTLTMTALAIWAGKNIVDDLGKR